MALLSDTTSCIGPSYHSIHDYVGDTVDTTLHLPARSFLQLQITCCVVGTYFITPHIRHLIDDRLENTFGANALMLMLDKLKLPVCVGHEPFLVSRPEGSTRKMQSPKKVAPSYPHRYRGLYLHEVSKVTNP